MSSIALNKIDCTTHVVTPENIEFEYQLAGPFQRLSAFAIDTLVRWGIFIGLLVFAGLLYSFVPVIGSISPLLPGIGYFLISWFYGVYMETRFNGRTLGKMAFRLRVISVDGRPIDAIQAALRNLLRLADMNVLLSMQMFSVEAPPLYIIPTMIVGLTSMLMTKRMQRVGDIAAGTMVISEHRKHQKFVILPDDYRAYGLAELIPGSFVVSATLAQTLGFYMETRTRFGVRRRNEMARHVSRPLIQQLGIAEDTSEDLLLCALYVKTFLSEVEQQRGMELLQQYNLQRSAKTNPHAMQGFPGNRPPVASSFPDAGYLNPQGSPLQEPVQNRPVGSPHDANFPNRPEGV